MNEADVKLMFEYQAKLREESITLQRRLNDLEVEQVIARHEVYAGLKPWHTKDVSLARRVDIVCGILELKLAEALKQPDYKKAMHDLLMLRDTRWHSPEFDEAVRVAEELDK